MTVTGNEVVSEIPDGARDEIAEETDSFPMSTEADEELEEGGGAVKVLFSAGHDHRILRSALWKGGEAEGSGLILRGEEVDETIAH